MAEHPRFTQLSQGTFLKGRVSSIIDHRALCQLTDRSAASAFDIRHRKDAQLLFSDAARRPAGRYGPLESGPAYASKQTKTMNCPGMCMVGGH